MATAPNNPPTITSTPRGSIRLGDRYLYQAEAADPDGDPLTFRLEQAPAGMTISAAGLVAWDTAGVPLGANPVRLRVEDGRGGAVVQSFTVTVVQRTSNQPPNIVSTPPFAATASRLYAYDLRATDPDSDPLTWSLDAAPVGVSLDPARGTLRWTPAADQVGTHSLTVRVVDGQGGYATQRFSITVRAVNTPPVVTSAAVTTASAGRPYIYAVRATDADGDPLTFALTTAPAGMTVGRDNGLVQWTPTANQLGPHAVTVRVEDGQGGVATQSYTVVVTSGAPNRPPVITSTPAFTAVVGSRYEYRVTASDPDGDPVTFRLGTAPAGMSIDPASGLVQWTPTAAQLGNHTVTVEAVDPAGNGGTQTYTLAVSDGNRPQTITSMPMQTVTAGLPYRYDVRASDPDGDPLSYRLDTAPAGMTIDGLGRILWSPGIPDIGTRRVAVTVADNRGGSVTQTFDLAVVADTQSPRVNLLLSSNPASLGSLVNIVVTATDNVGVRTLTLTVGGNPVALDGAGRATVRADRAGFFTVEATATDSAGLVGRAATTLAVIDPSDQDAPTVSLTTPAEEVVVTAAVNVIGTATDTNLLFYVLEAALLSGGPFVELFRGTTAVVNGVLGRFDPSGLANDTYVLRLSATDAGGNVSSVERTVHVAGDLKVGNFTLSFTDLSLPVSGIPITVARTYDTLQASRQRDLGFGWRLEFRYTDLRTSLVPPTPDEEEFGIFPALREGTRVYVTLPGGRREGFTFRPQRLSGFGGLFAFYRPAFVSDRGVTSQLSVPDNITLIRSGNEYFSLVSGGTLPYNPLDHLNFAGRYTLTTKDGLAYTIDARNGDLLSLADANGNTLTYSDTGIVSSAGPQVRFERDLLGRITAAIDPLGQRVRYQYDARGDLVAVTDRENNVTRFAYSTARPHYLEQVIDPLGRMGVRTEYDERGRLVRLIDAMDNPGRLTAVIDARMQRTEYSYDEAGNLVRQRDANGHVTRYEYDGLGRRVATVLPLGQRSTTMYDAVGNVLRTTDFNGQTVNYEYTPLNQLRARRLPDGSSFEFTYTPTGQRDTVTDARGVTRYTYDVRDRLEMRTDPDGQQIRYTYDAAGNRTSLTTAAGMVRYAFDDLNRLETVTDPANGVTRYLYNEVSALVRTDLPNGTFETREYDSLNRLTFLENRGPGGVISSYRYTLSPTGNRTAVVEHDGRRVDYTYDELYRLTRERITEGSSIVRTMDYVLDPVGNRLRRDDTGEGTTTYTYDDNDRLLTETLGGVATRYSYDANGNTLSRETSATDRATYRWNAENRLIGADVTESGTTRMVDYRYDADGIRVASMVGGQETRYLIDTVQPYAQVAMEYRPGGAVVVSYVRGEQLVSQDREGVRAYYHVDGLGSTRALTNASGVVTDRYAYDAFRRTIGQMGATVNLYLFAGEQRDFGVGLDYLRARYLNVRIGRFVNRDGFDGLLLLPISLHRYLYANGSPANNIDPSGLFVKTAELYATLTISAILAAAYVTTRLTLPGLSLPTDFQGQLPRQLHWRFRVAMNVLGLSLSVLAAKVATESLKLKKLPVIFYGDDLGEHRQHIFEALTARGCTHTRLFCLAPPLPPLLHKMAIDHPRWWLSKAKLCESPGQSAENRDEYPFAISEEGGKGNYDKNLVSVKLVDPGESSLQGGRMKQFFKETGVLPGNPFLVVPIFGLKETTWTVLVFPTLG